MAESTDPATFVFLGRALDHWAGTMAMLMAALGDRLGLFGALAPEPATADELAGRTGLDTRYLAEWAAALTTAGYLTHDPVTDRYTLPAAHVPALADESSPYFVGGGFQNLLGLLGVLDHVSDAFRTGAGVPYAEYPADTFDGMARLTGAAHEHALVPTWLPLCPEVHRRLTEGCRVADVGCGQGRAVMAMAAAFGASTFLGVDAHRPVIEHARAQAGVRQLGDRVRFEVGDVARSGLPDGPYDVAFAFDVLHDAADPPGLLARIADALTPEGTLVLLEPNAGATPEENPWPLGTVNYGISVLYCMSVSLGSGGPGLGTCGTPVPVVRQLLGDAGFTDVEEVPIGNLFNRMFTARR